MTKQELQEYADKLVAQDAGAPMIMRAAAQDNPTAGAMAVGMPMIFTIPSNTDFTIKDSRGNVVYSATANQPAGGTTVDIDLAPIFRQLVAPYNYANALPELTEYLADVFVQSFTLSTVEGDTAVKVAWDYSRRSVVPLTAEVTSEAVQDYIYLGQKFPVTGYNKDDKAIYIRFLFKYTGKVDAQIEPANTESFLYMQDPAKWDENTLSLQVISGMGDDATPLTPEYPRRMCIPAGAVTLFWVNPRGGITWVHCNRKNTAKTNVTRSQITRESDPTTPAAFGLDNYNIETYKSYALNTDFLTAEQSEKLQSLFIAPQVWLYDYADDSMVSVVVTDKSATIKNRENSGAMFNYTINVRDSQVYNIVG